jgi:hypothetical protein
LEGVLLVGQEKSVVGHSPRVREQLELERFNFPIVGYPETRNR